MVLVYGGVAELAKHLRGRRRLQRASAVVVGLVNVGGFRANSRSYAARFRFTTGDGRVVEVVSSLSTGNERTLEAIAVICDRYRLESGER